MPPLRTERPSPPSRSSRWGAALFRCRGPVLGVFACVFVLFARPTHGSLLLGGTVSMVGLAVRLWAISWIGPAARTRDPAPPNVRLVTGPYRLRHPLYIANTVVAMGFGLASHVPLTVLTPSCIAVAAFYAALAWREDQGLKLDGTPEGTRPRLSARATVRAERSTWATALVAFGVLAWLL